VEVICLKKIANKKEPAADDAFPDIKIVLIISSTSLILSLKL